MSKKSASKKKLGGTATAPEAHEIDGFSSLVGDCVHFTPAKALAFGTTWNSLLFKEKMGVIEGLLKRHPGARGVLFIIPMEGGAYILSPMAVIALAHTESFARAIATGT